MKKGLSVLLKETLEEKVARLQRELYNERIGRVNDNAFCDAEYEKLAKVTLEFCDNNCGDITVGERPCPYYIDDEFGSGYNCELKRYLGL